MRSIQFSPQYPRSVTIHWWVVAVLTAILALSLCSLATGGDVKRAAEPALLPPAVKHEALPMKWFELQKAQGVSVTSVREAMELYDVGDHEMAAAAWMDLELTCDSLVWKHIVLARIYLNAGQLDLAGAELEIAQDVDGENPVVYLLTGFLYSQQAKTAPREWNGLQNDGTVFVASPSVVPYSQSMLRFAARQQLQKALVRSDAYDPQAPITSIDEPWGCETTASELMMTLGLSDWQAQANLGLGRLFLLDGRLDSAERHLDYARELGLPCAATYETLAAAHAQTADWSGASRNHAKAIAAGGSLFQGVANIVNDLRFGVR